MTGIRVLNTSGKKFPLNFETFDIILLNVANDGN